jgi:hypothetical protein
MSIEVTLERIAIALERIAESLSKESLSKQIIKSAKETTKTIKLNSMLNVEALNIETLAPPVPPVPPVLPVPPVPPVLPALMSEVPVPQMSVEELNEALLVEWSRIKDRSPIDDAIKEHGEGAVSLSTLDPSKYQVVLDAVKMYGR